MSNKLYKTTGKTTTQIWIPDPKPPDPPMDPEIPKPPGDPLNPPDDPLDPPGEDPFPPANGVNLVQCTPGPNGEDRFSIWSIDSKGRLIRQISPCA